MRGNGLPLVGGSNTSRYQRRLALSRRTTANAGLNRDGVFGVFAARLGIRLTTSEPAHVRTRPLIVPPHRTTFAA